MAGKTVDHSRALVDLQASIAPRIAGGEDARHETRAGMRKRHNAEIKVSQDNLSQNVVEASRLVVASDKMLSRHSRECDEADEA